ncbi:MAG TPA: hypothetical protein VFR27_10560, partial [Mycobacterium sp.]|nr:hypothetical protein [Mycobacterium sp.]
MDVALGVAVTGPLARLTLVESGPGSPAVLDQSVLDVASAPVEALTETVVGTHRMLASEGHRLVATQLYWPDSRSADDLRQALDQSGVANVTVVSEAQVAGEATMSWPRGGDSTATMASQSARDGDTITALAAQTDNATMLAPAATVAEPGMTAAQAAADVGPEPQLAYSMADDDVDPLSGAYDGGGYFDDGAHAGDAVAPPVGRALLVGSTVGGIVVAGCAALAVAVTVGIRPTAASQPHPAPAPAQPQPVPGNFVPALPAPRPPVQTPLPPAANPGAGLLNPAPQQPPAPPPAPPVAVPSLAPPPPPAAPPVIPIP